MKKINCFKCKYFYTTWNSKFPRGCKGYGFKTKEIPSVYVQKTTGQPCLQFTPNHNHDNEQASKVKNSQSIIDFKG